jgi:putative hemolysin
MSLAAFDIHVEEHVQPSCDRSVAREITYAHSASSAPARAFIRAVENATGRIGLIRRCAGYEAEVAQGRDFWRVMMERFGLTLDVRRGSLGAIPAEGPLVVVSNHPYGILDGLVMGHVLSAIRGGDFRIIAHQVFQKAEDVTRVILPIDFSGTRAAVEANLRTRAAAISYLKGGGAIGIFPGGTVSTAATPGARPMDPVWRGFTARMIAKSGATVVPIWFEGQNSRLFQLSSHLNYTLRMSLLVREFRARVDRPVQLVVGNPIGPETLSRHAGDSKLMMDFLRRSTYELSPEPLDPMALGLEYEEQYKR